MPYCPCGNELKRHQKAYCCKEHKARYHRHVPSTHFGVPRHQEKMLMPGVMNFLYGAPPALSENSGYRWTNKGFRE